MTDSKTAERKKLSVIPKGHWRNQYTGVGRWINVRTGELIVAKVLTSPWRWPSREIAEEKAAEAKFKQPDWDDVEYLGPVFFPD